MSDEVNKEIIEMAHEHIKRLNCQHLNWVRVEEERDELQDQIVSFKHCLGQTIAQNAALRTQLAEAGGVSYQTNEEGGLKMSEAERYRKLWDDLRVIASRKNEELAELRAENAKLMAVVEAARVMDAARTTDEEEVGYELISKALAALDKGEDK